VVILAVDDEPNLNILTKEFLEMSSYIKVDTAGSVSEARAMIAQKRYDVIVSDYQMPGEDGIQFLKSLRASGDNTPFILFTGKGREEVVIEAFDNGADAYLQKGGEQRSLFAELENRIGTIIRRHHAEAALMDSELEFRTLFENNPDSVILISIEGRILNCNDVATKILRMRKEELIGASIFDLEVFRSDDLELFRHNLMARAKGESTAPIVSQIHYSDGTTKWVEGRASVIMKAGRCDSFQIIAQDITERKRTEQSLTHNFEELNAVKEELRKQLDTILRAQDELKKEKVLSEALIESLPGVFYLYDGQTKRMVNWNKNHELVSGYTKEEMLGKYALDWFRPEDKEAALAEMDNCMSKGTTNLEAPLVMKDGRVVPYLFTSSRLLTKEGSFFMGVGIDITERKRMEEKLRQKTALFEAQVASSIDGILVIDKNFRRILFNQRIIDLFDVPQHIMDNEDDNLLLEHVMNLSKYPEQFIEKVKYLNEQPNETSRDEIEFKNGMVLERYSAPVLGRDGEHYGRTWTFRDVTDRKQVEVALRESEARYRSLFQDNSVPIHLIDPATGDIADVNQAACEYYGYQRNELIKMNISQINTLSPEDAKKEMERSVRGGKRKFNFRHRLANGEVRDVEVYSSPIYLDGKPFLYSIVHDITDRRRFEKALKEREEQQSKILATIPDFVIMTDLTGNIILVNNPTLTHSGYMSEEVVGHKLISLIAPEDVSKAVENINIMIAGRPVPAEYDLIMKDGRRILFDVRGNVLRDSGGNPIGLVFVCRDSTERHQMESELNDAKGKLNVLYNITRHDINNQLMALSGYLSLMEKNDLHTTSDRYLEKAKAAVKRISSMVDFTKEYENIGVKAPIWHEIRTLADKSSKEADLGKIEVVNEIPEGTEVFADPMFFKVIQNLMNNSIRHGEHVTKVRLSIKEKDAGGSLVFEDDGVGIPVELKEKIFVEGFGKDHGLGLFLCKEILSMTDINITEVGEPGKGARFVITPPHEGIRTV
jgi:PAS domain S-box-containing protein